MHGLHCALIEYYALSPGASTKSCVPPGPSFWRSFEAQRVMLDESALKRVIYFHISRIPRLTFFLSPRCGCPKKSKQQTGNDEVDAALWAEAGPW